MNLFKKKKTDVEIIKDKKKNTIFSFCIFCKKETKLLFSVFFSRSADESETKLFTCTQCNKTWRENY